MAVGDIAGKVLRTTAGIMSEIDPKNTAKYLAKEGMTNRKMMQTSGAYRAGKAATSFLTTGGKGTMKAMKQGEGFTKAVIKGHSNMVNGKPQLSAKKVAGTALGVGLAGRAVTGGGLYRDRYGNTNIPGVPFF